MRPMFPERQDLQSSLLTRNIKEFNVIFLILIAILIIGIAGGSSLALFSMETNSTAKITGTVIKPKSPTGADTIIAKVGTGGLVVESHPATEQLVATTDYRYTGKTPNNYIRFNDELWRIIGVFDTDDGTGKLEKRIKIIRKDFIGYVVWDSNNQNDWTKASGMTLLNLGDYWNRTGSYAGLTDKSKKQIADAKWYLGGAENYSEASNGLVSHFYGYERGKTVYEGRPTSWVGKVGLMYPSDYGYATSGGTAANRDACLAKELNNWVSYSDTIYSDCYNNDWLYDTSGYQWTLTPDSDTTNSVLYIRDEYITSNSATNTRATKPTTFLTSNIQITGGTGTSTDPYQLSL